MVSKNRVQPEMEEHILEKLAISDYVRLCLDEGITPSQAFRQIKDRIRTAKEMRSR